MSNEKINTQVNHQRPTPRHAVNSPEFKEWFDTEPPNIESLKGLTVRQKLVVSLAVLAGILAIVAGIGYMSISFAANGFEVVTQEILQESKAIAQLKQGSLSLLNETREYSIEPDEETLAQIETANEALETALANYGTLDQLYHDSQRQLSKDSLSDHIDETTRDVQRLSEEIVFLSNAGVSDEKQLAEAFEAFEDAEIELATRLDKADKFLEAEIVGKVGRIGVEINRSQTLLIFLPLVALGIFLGIFYFLNESVVGRLKTLEAVAQRISGGNLNLLARVDSRDEIGMLAYAFNNMTGQLRKLLNNLEESVAERTHQLETVVEVSQRLSSILDLSDLMQEVVNLTKVAFNYYHVHIYLLDEWGEMLVMVEGYGEAGLEMKKQGHTIPLTAPRSLVARAARDGKIISFDDVRKNPDWLQNPLLPETRSEAAVPIYLGNEIVGVLDVQSEKIAGITPENERILLALASQVATAVGNARLFRRTQEALSQAEHLQSLYTGEAWQKLAKEKRLIFEISRSNALAPLPETFTPEAKAALKQKQTINLGSDVSSRSHNGGDRNQEQNDGTRKLATPLKLRNQVIGVLGLQDNNLERRWTSEEIALVEAISEQMSLALESARLSQETQRSAWRDQVVSESTAKVWSSSEMEEVMKAAVAQLGDKLKASEVVIRLTTDNELESE